MNSSVNCFVLVREVRVNYVGKRHKIYNSITESQHAADIIKKLLPDNSREHFISLYLNGNSEVIAYSIVGTGTATSCQIHVRESFRPAILSGAVSVLMAHNHPSGNCMPSKDDRMVTNQVKAAGELLNIKLLDHLIVTETEHYSFNTVEWP